MSDKGPVFPNGSVWLPVHTWSLLRCGELLRSNEKPDPSSVHLPNNSGTACLFSDLLKLSTFYYLASLYASTWKHSK